MRTTQCSPSREPHIRTSGEPGYFYAYRQLADGIFICRPKNHQRIHIRIEQAQAHQEA